MEHKIKPEWRTSTVVAICLQMRELQEFSGMPILADALQDADCDDRILLESLRAGGIFYSVNSRLVAIVMSDESAQAVKWLEQFAQKVDCTYEKALSGGRMFVASRDPSRDLNGENLDIVYELQDYSTLQDYWKNFRLATGCRLPEGTEDVIPFEDPDDSYECSGC